MRYIMYEIVYDKKCINFLNKLPLTIKERIYKKLQSTKQDPFIYFERLSGRDDYKLRVGDYRAIADIDIKNKTIQVTVIGHRKNIY